MKTDLHLPFWIRLKKKVKAIFFVTYDFAKDNPKLIKRMIDEGHIVGNHTYRHYTMDEVSEETATEEIMYLHNYIKRILIMK